MNKKHLVNENILTWIVISLIVILIFSVVFDFKISLNNNDGKINANIILINGCEECFDMSLMIEGLQNEEKLEITSIEEYDYNSEEGKSLIESYEIKQIPALIIKSKNIQDLGYSEDIFKIGNKFLVFENSVPYLDLETETINGGVILKEIQDSTCFNCAGMSQIEDYLKESGVYIKERELIGAESEKGQILIKENNINFLTSLLISKDIEKYWWIFPELEGFLIETEDYYLLNQPFFPYFDIGDGEVKGEVSIKYITNMSCEECSDVDMLRNIFLSTGIYLDSEETIDISTSEGKNLVLKYNITQVPSVILSEEILDYESLLSSFEEVGSFESDYSYVFRSNDQLNIVSQEI